jgi:hypothetical protein
MNKLSNILAQHSTSPTTRETGMNTKKNSGGRSSINNALLKKLEDQKRRHLARETKQQADSLKRQKEFSEKTAQWNSSILPRWDEYEGSRRLRDMCAKGIPPNIRGKVWPLLIGNALNIDEQLFDDLNKRVLKTHGKLKSSSTSPPSSSSRDRDRGLDRDRDM